MRNTGAPRSTAAESVATKMRPRPVLVAKPKAKKAGPLEEHPRLRSGLMADEHIEWLRALVSGKHLTNLADALTSGRLFEPDLKPLLDDIVARGWVSAEDVALARAHPGLRWEVRRERSENLDMMGCPIGSR
jgi:hypothetical protein